MSNLGFNKVILIGNAGQDAEIKPTTNGKSVVNFSLAINNSFQKKNGEKVQRVEWVRCVAWNKQAEIAERFVTKGKQIFVEGRLQTRRYEDSEGAPRIVSEVVVTTLRVLGGTTKDTHGQAADDSAPKTAAESDQEDIPF